MWNTVCIYLLLDSGLWGNCPRTCVDRGVSRSCDFLASLSVCERHRLSCVLVSWRNGNEDGSVTTSWGGRCISASTRVEPDCTLSHRPPLFILLIVVTDWVSCLKCPNALLSRKECLIPLIVLSVVLWNGTWIAIGTSIAGLSDHGVGLCACHRHLVLGVLPALNNVLEILEGLLFENLERLSGGPHRRCVLVLKFDPLYVTSECLFLHLTGTVLNAVVGGLVSRRDDAHEESKDNNAHFLCARLERHSLFNVDGLEAHLLKELSHFSFYFKI